MIKLFFWKSDEKISSYINTWIFTGGVLQVSKGCSSSCTTCPPCSPSNLNLLAPLHTREILPRRSLGEQCSQKRSSLMENNNSLSPSPCPSSSPSSSPSTSPCTIEDSQTPDKADQNLDDNDSGNWNISPSKINVPPLPIHSYPLFPHHHLQLLQTV